MVRLALLLGVVLHLNTAMALSMRSAGKSSKIAALRDGLHRLGGRQRTEASRWVTAAVFGGALLTLTTTSTFGEAEQHSSSVENMTVANSELAATISHAVAEENTPTTQMHTLSWAIEVTTKGEIAHMHVQAMELEDGINITGYLEPTVRGRRYIEPEPVFSYLADKSYAIKDRSYNGFTLPLRLSWLASERRRVLNEVHGVLRTIAASEHALVTLGDSMYKRFSKLDVADDDDYEFDNLAEQIEVKFAGRRFIDRSAVREAIERRHLILQVKRIAYKQRLPGEQLDQEVLHQAEAAYRDALALLQYVAVPTIDLKPNFDAEAATDENFMALVESLARLKQARLLLAEEILSFYEPFQVPFFYAAGVRENLNIAVFADDSKYRGVAFRYVSFTTSANHRELFTLGHVDFDHNLNIKKMWMSLKPRGGWSGNFAKLTFTPCLDGACPEPDFE